MKLYPVQLNLQDKLCVIVGAGSVAERKVRSLLETGASIKLVAPEATQALQHMAASGALVWMQTAYKAMYLDGAFLVIAAANEAAVNETVAADANQRNILVSRADDPTGGSFVSPASITRGDLILSISTSGASPTLASVLRQRLGVQFGAEWGLLTQLIGSLRPKIQAQADESARRAMVERLIDDVELRQALVSGNLDEAGVRARKCLSSS